MNMTKSVLTIGALAAIAFAVPLQAQTSLSLYGDIDCFGTGGPCVEDGSTWLPGGAPSVTATASDAALTDRVFNTSGISSWTHTFAATTSDAWLRMRTAGIADVAGPYSVFVDGMMVGSMPFDASSHFLVETFAFMLPGSLLADGSATVSFTSVAADGWALDYSEIYTTASVPEPGTLFLLGTGLLGLAFRKRREESSVL